MIDYSITSDLSKVRELTDVLHSFCTKHKLNETLSSQLELILVEAVNNVIEHAYQNKQGLSIDTVFEVNSIEVTLTIKDYGLSAPVEIHEVDRTMPDINPDISDLPEGGWGLALIHSLADQVKHFRENGNNTLIISKLITN